MIKYKSSRCEKQKTRSGGISMHFIADILTTIRLILIFVLAHFVNVGAPFPFALGVFVIGEITDALDGFFAKKFPYPENNKFFWRVGKFPKIYDTGTDLILAITYAAYFYKYIDETFTLVVIPVSFVLGVFVEYLIRTPEFKESPKATLRIIDVRRLLYGIALFVVFARSILALEVSIDLKYTLEVLLGVVGVLVLIFKGNRLREK